MHQNKGYKAIANILNQQQIPAPKSEMWSWSTIWHVLHNEAYIGKKIWNKYDYSKGKKKKPPEEWIVKANAHPAIIDHDTFNAVSKKSTQRNPTGAAYKATEPSPYILRGMLKCPMCNANMVSGSNSKNSRGYNRYYHCGTYHRKGSKACKRNSLPKDKMENAVIHTLIREFSLLVYPDSLDEEINKYIKYENRETTYQLMQINDEIKHLQRRLEIAKKEKKIQKTSITKIILQILTSNLKI